MALYPGILSKLNLATQHAEGAERTLRTIIEMEQKRFQDLTAEEQESKNGQELDQDIQLLEDIADKLTEAIDDLAGFFLKSEVHPCLTNSSLET